MPDSSQDNYKRNFQWVKPGDHVYNTVLPDDMEQKFRIWIMRNNVPFNPFLPVPDYDMRGFYSALSNGDERASPAVDPNDGRMHYPDYWKTPYHETFSNESQWANPDTAPKWNDKDQLITTDGNVLYDDRAENGK